MEKCVAQGRLPCPVLAFNQDEATLGLAGGFQASLQRFELIAPIDEDRRPVLPDDVNSWRRCVARRRKERVTATWLTLDELRLARVVFERST